MAGAGSAGESHGRRRRAGTPPGGGRSADHNLGSAPRPERAGDRSGTAERGAGTESLDSGSQTERSGHPVRAFFRANPQVLVLLVICVVLGLGTFLVVLLGLVTTGSDQTTGEPSGAVLGAHSLAAAGHSLAAAGCSVMTGAPFSAPVEIFS